MREAEWKKQRAQLIDEAKQYSARISERVRTMVLGSLAVIWGPLVGNEHQHISLTHRDDVILTGIALLAVLTLLCEFLEYLFAEAALNSSASDELKWNYGLWWFRSAAKWSKMLFGGLTALSLAATLGIVLIHDIDPPASTSKSQSNGSLVVPAPAQQAQL